MEVAFLVAFQGEASLVDAFQVASFQMVVAFQVVEAFLVVVAYLDNSEAVPRAHLDEVGHSLDQMEGGQRVVVLSFQAVVALSFLEVVVPSCLEVEALSSQGEVDHGILLVDLLVLVVP